MTFLPIVERELRVASRRRSTYLGRLAGAVIAMAVAGWIMLTMSGNSPAQLGVFLFGGLSVILFIYSIGAGARVTSDCLSEEKREGTLGLLFLTDLKGYDIVAGKLAANSLNTFYGLLSAFPVLAISLLMGGVTSAEFWRVTLVAINLLFLSLATGMFASSVCRDERKATSLAFFILLVLLAGSPLIEMALNIADHNRARTSVFLWPSPAFACFSAFGKKIGFQPADFWIPVLLTQLYGWLFLILASGIVPRAWQDKTTKNPLEFSNFWRLVFPRDATKEKSRRTELLEINPFLWLAGRDFLKTALVRIVLLTLSAIWIWGWATWPKEWVSIPVCIMTAITLHGLLKFWVASEACHRFVQDRKIGALELLLSTPLSVAEILRGQRLALFRQFSGAVVFVLAVDFLFIFLGLNDREFALNSLSDKIFWAMLWAAGIIIFVMDLYAISWVGMWMALRSQKVNRASGAALTRILMLPWIAFFLSLTLWGTLLIGGRVGWDEKVMLVYWFLLCVINNMIFINWAKRNLFDRFREIATQRFEPRPSRFRFLKSSGNDETAGVPPLIK
ncbi:MAG: ABC transporter permease [Verrucomicrobiota bacterium]